MPDYRLKRRLGSGNFGEVWLVYERALNVHLAVKYVRPSRIHDPTNFYQEPRTLQDLLHENIVRVEDAGRLENGTLYIAMEYLPEGSVESKFGGQSVPLSLSKKFLCDLCWGLEYAHLKGYVHRDIKPGNILIGRSGEAKLSDFGLATRVPRGTSASPYGYLTHVAPEVFAGVGTSANTDIYALGVTAYRLVNGDALLPQPSEHGELQDMIIRGEYPNRNLYRYFVPQTIRRCINKAMSVEPDSRYHSASEFRRALEGIYIHCDWSQIRRRRLTIFRTTINNSIFRVRVSLRDNGHFDISTTKQKSKGNERRILADCDTDLTKTQVRRRLKQILSRYVANGR